MVTKIAIEVAYATPEKQIIISLAVEAGTTIEKAIHSSEIMNFFPDIDLSQQKVGIFGQAKLLTDRVQAGDRIEIYRPLLINPKDARRKRVDKKPTP